MHCCKTRLCNHRCCRSAVLLSKRGHPHTVCPTLRLVRQFLAVCADGFVQPRCSAGIGSSPHPPVLLVAPPPDTAPTHWSDPSPCSSEPGHLLGCCGSVACLQVKCMGMAAAGPAGHQSDSHGAPPISVAGHQGMQHIRPEALRHSERGGCEVTRCMLLTCSNVYYLMKVFLHISSDLLSVAAVRSTSMPRGFYLDSTQLSLCKAICGVLKAAVGLWEASTHVCTQLVGLRLVCILHGTCSSFHE